MTTPPISARSDDPPVTHAVRLFVGPPLVLARFRDLAPTARIYALTAGSDLPVLPFDDDVQDALHRVIGTGDYPEEAASALSTTDLAFALTASHLGPLAYVETDYTAAAGTQAAAFWTAGHLAMPPTVVDTATALSRPPAFWPINAALRALGIRATPPSDEFTTFGLRAWTSNAEIHAHARRLA